jgi:hypothetical protein
MSSTRWIPIERFRVFAREVGFSPAGTTRTCERCYPFGQTRSLCGPGCIAILSSHIFCLVPISHPNTDQVTCTFCMSPCDMRSKFKFKHCEKIWKKSCMFTAHIKITPKNFRSKFRTYIEKQKRETQM